MKSIRHRILFFTLLPFLTVYSALSIFIVYQVYRLQIKEAEQELHNQAMYHASNLLKSSEIMELSVKITARELEMIDPRDPSAREMGDNIITTRFHNPGVLNVWLAFEPDAFDGDDSAHAGEYAGAPSGRYIRSYYRKGDSWIMVDDMDENSLNDVNKSFYYVIPMETGTFYTSLGVNELLWDYGFGPVYVFGVSEPVFRDGKPIGCVGFDVLVNEETVGNNDIDNSVSAFFLADGRLCYFQNYDEIGKTLEDLKFKNCDAIMNYFKDSNNEMWYNFTGYSGLSGVKSLNHFYPARINNNVLFIYTSIPQSTVFLRIIPVILPIGSSFIVCLAVFSVLFMYFSRGIAAPLKKLSETSESIVSGNLGMNINVVDSNDEMGLISKSLVRMAEQFRVSKVLQERYQDQIDIILRTHYALFRSPSLEEAFDAELTMISEYYGVFKGTLVFLIKESPRIVAVYPVSVREEGDSEFYAHAQIVNLLENKKLLAMNEGTLREMQLPFADYSTRSLCIIPLRMNEVLRGYIILEGNKPDAMIHDDTTLLFLGNTLSYLIGSKVDWDQEANAMEKSSAKNFFSSGSNNQEISIIENTDEFLEKAKNIQYLNIEKGILFIGGEKDKYAKLLQVTIKVISETIIKLRQFHTGNLRAFAIEIHGVKGALSGIGAETLAEEAGQLEFAAKSDDAGYCRDNYPHLEEKLRGLSRNIAALFPQQKHEYRKGNITELEELLIQAQEACNNFDLLAVNTILSPLVSHDWDNEIIKEILSNILSDMDNLEYERTNDRITQLLEIIRNPGQ